MEPLESFEPSLRSVICNIVLLAVDVGARNGNVRIILVAPRDTSRAFFASAVPPRTSQRKVPGFEGRDEIALD